MTDREIILSKLNKSKPAASPLPQVPSFPMAADPMESFTSALQNNHAKVIRVKSAAEAAERIRETYPDAKLLYSMVETVPSNIADENAASLAQLDLAVLKAECGVADNGALWINDETCPIRVLPFIAQHLVIMVDKSSIVGNLHDAYNIINPAKAGFGVFITGPSKTGDIEQALVVGAQGPVSMLVLVVG